MFRGSQGQQGQKGQSILSGCCAALMKCRRSGSPRLGQEGGAHSSVTTTATLAIMPAGPSNVRIPRPMPQAGADGADGVIVVPASAFGDDTGTSRKETFEAAAGSTAVTLR